MKIISLADNQFEDEGHSAEELTPETELEVQKELDDKSIGKRTESHTAEVVSKMEGVLGHSLESSYVANGCVGWFQHSDGIIYEVLVSPAAYGHYFGWFKELRSRKTNPDISEKPEKPENPEDDLTM